MGSWHKQSLVGAFFLWGWLAIGYANAQQPADRYPSDTVRLVVPFSAGGTADVMARVLAQGLSEKWKQAVIVENKPGATGGVAAVFVKQSPANGYVLLVGGGSVNSIPEAIRTDLQYDTLTDFEPITNVALLPNLLVVNPSVPALTVKDLVAALKAKPRQFSFGSAGIASSGHLAGELFKLVTGTDMVHVPYRGSAPGTVDLMAGHIQLMFDNMPTVLPLAKQGRLVALGVTSKQRVLAEPDIPSIAEFYPEFEAVSWVGLLAPAKTPNAVISKISEAVREILRHPATVEKLGGLGATPAANRPDEFRQFLQAEIQKWRDVATKGGISIR